MKFMFIPISNKGFVIETELALSMAINKGCIDDYIKIPNLKTGTYLVCDRKNAMLKHNNKTKIGAGYKQGLCFKIVRIALTGDTPIFFGAHLNNGVYPEEVRLATEEEIKNFEKRNKESYNMMYAC